MRCPPGGPRRRRAATAAVTAAAALVLGAACPRAVRPPADPEVLATTIRVVLQPPHRRWLDVELVVANPGTHPLTLRALDWEVGDPAVARGRTDLRVTVPPRGRERIAVKLDAGAVSVEAGAPVLGMLHGEAGGPVTSPIQGAVAP